MAANSPSTAAIVVFTRPLAMAPITVRAGRDHRRYVMGAAWLGCRGVYGGVALAGERNTIWVISEGRPRRIGKPGHSPVPLLTYSVMPPTWYRPET
ncbi:hypothetical protein G6F57_023003 [Rhizopus arrhizus]|nr:hypothetical protein G6F57_023003 [Rhizopus arrhizus]